MGRIRPISLDQTSVPKDCWLSLALQNRVYKIFYSCKEECPGCIASRALTTLAQKPCSGTAPPHTPRLVPCRNALSLSKTDTSLHPLENTIN